MSKLKDFWYWMKEHFTKDFWRVFKEVITSVPYDFQCIHRIEKAKLIETANYIEKHKRYVGWETDVRDMRICVSLIEIFTDEREISHFEGKIEWEDVPDHPELQKMGGNLHSVCDVKVNLKNLLRFVKDPKIHYIYEKLPQEFYKIKAKALYYEIRKQRESSWWD